MEFEWNIFPGFNTLQLSQEVQELLLRLYETPEIFTGRIIFMSMFNDISWGSKDNKIEGQWSFLGLGSEKNGTLSVKIVHKVNGTKWQKNDGDTGRKRTPSLSSLESIVQRSAQEQRRWKIVDPLLCRPGHDYNCSSHNNLCKSAQSLRSSRRNA